MKGQVLTNRSKDRASRDFYATPVAVTVALLEFLNLPKNTIIWEPAAGTLKMSKVIRDWGYKVKSSDIHSDHCQQLDFLNDAPLSCDAIITNPPFNAAERFIRRAIRICNTSAFLLKCQFWHSSKRLRLFTKHPPKYILPLTWRPDFLYKAKGGAPTMDCIWCVWIKGKVNTLYRPLPKPEIRRGGLFI